MSEFLANLLRFSSLSFYLLFLIAGVYLGGAGLAADVQGDMYQDKYVNVMKKAAPADRTKTLSIVVKHKAENTWLKLTAKFVTHPKIAWEHVKWAIPALNFGSGAVLSLKGIESPHIWNQARVVWHQGLFILVGLMLAIGGELIVFPLLRSRLAHKLASTDEQMWGRPEDLPSGDGFVLAHDVRLDRSGGGNPHVLTIAPSGAGKSTTNVLPSILQTPKDCAVVCTDPKVELHARSAEWLENEGHPVYMVAPLGGYGHGWNPLSECQSVDDVRELSRQLILAGDESAAGGGGNWNNMSRSCLSSYLIQTWVAGGTIADALALLFADKASGEAVTESAAQTDWEMFDAMRGSENTAKSILATIQGATQVWQMDAVVAWMKSPRQLRLDQIRKEKAAVFLVSTASDADAIRPIQQLFFTRLFNQLAKGGEGGDVRILLDELANIGKLHGLDRSLNLLRSARVQIHGFIQNLSQLQDVYGPASGNVIAESFGTLTCLAGLRKDAEELAKMMGLQNEVKSSFSTMDEKMRAQHAQNQNQVMQASELRQLKKDEVLIVCNHFKPVIGTLKPYYGSRRLLSRIPSQFRSDWSKVPQQAIDELMEAVGKIDPVKSEPPKILKPKTARKPRKKPEISAEIQGMFDS